MLLERLEQEFDLPPLLIDGGDRTGGQVHEVCQKCQPALLRLVPDRHLPQGDRASVGCMQAGQANHLIGEHGAPERDGAPLHDRIQHVGAWAGDKPALGHGPAMIRGIVQIATIHRDNGPRRKGKLLRHTDIVDVAFGDECPTGQTALMIEFGDRA